MFKYQIDYRYYRKYRIFNYEYNPYENVDTSNMNSWELMVYHMEKRIWESITEKTTENIIRQSHEKSTANYKRKVEKLIK